MRRSPTAWCSTCSVRNCCHIKALLFLFLPFGFQVSSLVGTCFHFSCCKKLFARARGNRSPQFTVNRALLQTQLRDAFSRSKVRDEKENEQLDMHWTLALRNIWFSQTRISRNISKIYWGKSQTMLKHIVQKAWRSLLLLCWFDYNIILYNAKI